MNSDLEIKELLSEIRDLMKGSRERYDAYIKLNEDWHKKQKAKSTGYINWLLFGITVIAAGVYMAEFLIRIQFPGK